MSVKETASMDNMMQSTEKQSKFITIHQNDFCLCLLLLYMLLYVAFPNIHLSHHEKAIY